MTPASASVSKYVTVIGLEVHSQLLTASKMFCGCGATYASEPPNTHVCPVCLGLPGALPVINSRAVEFAAMTGLALNCDISEFTRFDRKQYFYPDMMKNYQTSQYDNPVAHDGWLEIEADGETARIRVKRVHLEEDACKLAHRVGPDGRPYSLVDVNRGGTPLMEIVSEPDMRSPEQARAYLVKLRNILICLGVSTGNMEEGSFRCDANVSIMREGSAELGAKVEIKNMNSFRGVYRALEHEVERQAREIEAGGRIVQETRGWDDERGVTYSQRSKEQAHDYRYFPEPDLPPLVLSREWVDVVRSRLPELPDAKRSRLVAEHGLSQYDAALLVASRDLADFFERTVALGASAKGAANWLLNDVAAQLNAAGIELSGAKLTPAALAGLVKLVEGGTINSRAAREVFAAIWETGKSADEVVAERGLTQVSDLSAIEPVVDQVIAGNAQSVGDYRAGKKQALGFLVGQVMRLSRGKANPALVSQILTGKLDAPE